MKAIFKIEEYLPDTTQIVVRFARLHAPELIENYRKVAVDYSQLDCYDRDTFITTLMRKCGYEMVKMQEDSEPTINVVETISDEFNIQDMVGKTIGCKIDDSRRAILKMRRVEL